MSKEVSIIMPNYNCLEFLPKAIDSVMLQKDVRFELLVIDDGSTDGSLEWLLKAQEKYSQLKVISQSNLGVIAARNRAINKANSEFIAFLDADDYWQPNKLRAQLDYMLSHPKCGLTFTNYEHIDMQYKPIIDCFSYWPEFKKYRKPSTLEYQPLPDPVNFLLIANVIGTSCVVARKKALLDAGGFDPSLRSASDWDCWLRVALDNDIAFSEHKSMDYLMRPNSITANKQKRLDAMADITNRIGSLNVVKQSTRDKANSRLLESYGEMYREQQDYKRAFECSLQAFKTYPHKRHLKHLYFDCKQLLKLKVNAINHV